MLTISENLFEVTNNEFRTLNASDFKTDCIIYVRDKNSNAFIYIINLIKGPYKTFSLKSYVENAISHNKLSCIAGNRSGMTPYYIRHFIDR